MNTYTVQPGDTLSKIAIKVFGDMSKWPDIAQINGIQSPYILRIGQTLTLPYEGPSSQGVPTLLSPKSKSVAPTTPLPVVVNSKTINAQGGTTLPQGAKQSSGFSLSAILQNKKLLIGGATILIILAVALPRNK